MSWLGELRFGDSWALFRGSAAENTPHAHAALQLVFGDARSTKVISADRSEFTAPVLAIRPLVKHRLVAEGLVTLLWIETKSALAFRVAEAIGDSQIAALPPSVLGLNPDLPLHAWSNRLDMLDRTGRMPADARLLQALALLAHEPGQIGISAAARHCELSESRLRALGRTQLGLPLSTWLIWRKLDRASRALQSGLPLATAAAMGGFADQAHLSRAMRRMFGITPRAAQNVATPHTRIFP